MEDGFVVTFLDINNRKGAEEKLRQYQANLEAQLENTDDCIWSINNNYKITTINTAFQKKYLLLTKTLINVGDTLSIENLPQKLIPTWQNYLKRAMGGERFRAEIAVEFLDKEYIYEYSFNPIKDDKGRQIGISVFGRDISERIKAEKEIKQKSQMLNSILNNLPVVLFRFCPEGTITESLGAGLKNLQLDNHQIIGKSALEIFPELESKYNKIKEGKPINFLSRKTFGEREYFFENYVFPDEILKGGIVGFAIDVTELKEVEQALIKAKEAAEKANHAKNYFLANMSHDLRTPIHAILGFAQILKENLNSSDALKYLNYIESSGKLLYNLVDDILQLTKTEEGKLELYIEPFSLKEVIISNLHPYQFQANKKGLHFHIDFDDSIPEYCIGDSGKITRIVINLIGNSLKFTSKGSIKVNFSYEKSANANCNELLISVSDTGIGIPKEKHEIIFKSFTQAEPAITKNFGGSGLGLAIVKQLVELMGGDLGLNSPINDNEYLGGKGSEFWIRIPLKEVNDDYRLKKTQSSLKEPHALKNLKILLVEDNEVNQQLVSLILTKLGCLVSVASNGNESISSLKEEMYDLVLMDVQMPILDGLEASRIIRKNINKDIPIIGLSANIYKEDIKECLASGMNDFLGKPFSEKDLYNKIIQWVPKVRISKDIPSSVNKIKITNLSFLKNLFDGDEKAVKVMVDEYFRFQKTLLEKMEDSLNKNNYKDIVSLAHKMRSSIHTLGLTSLYEPLVKLEKTALTGKDHSMMVKLVEKIKNINHQAFIEVEAKIKPDN